MTLNRVEFPGALHKRKFVLHNAVEKEKKRVDELFWGLNGLSVRSAQLFHAG